jgi:hypothetical protein
MLRGSLLTRLVVSARLVISPGAGNRIGVIEYSGSQVMACLALPRTAPNYGDLEMAAASNARQSEEIARGLRGEKSLVRLRATVVAHRL